MRLLVNALVLTLHPYKWQEVMWQTHSKEKAPHQWLYQCMSCNIQGLPAVSTCCSRAFISAADLEDEQPHCISATPPLLLLVSRDIKVKALYLGDWRKVEGSPDECRAPDQWHTIFYALQVWHEHKNVLQTVLERYSCYKYCKQCVFFS